MITANETYRVVENISATNDGQAVTISKDSIIQIMKLDSDSSNVKLVVMSNDPSNRPLLVASKVDVALNTEAY